MAYIGKKPSDITRAIATNDTFTGDGSTTTFTLSQGAASANDLTVVVNNVRQEPGSGSKSYTLTAPTSLVFNTAPVASDEIYVINPTQVEAIVRAGDISSGVITGQTAETTPADGDTLLMFDASATALRKITKANLFTGITTNATHTGEVTGATALTIADNAVTLAKMASGTDGNLITYDASGNPAYVATGSAGQILTSAGTGAPPTFATANSGIFRNIIINGDMNISQRSTSVASITSDGYYALDRFLVENGSFGTWTMSQAADAPVGYGFTNSLKMDCTTAQGSPSANGLLLIGQSIEGQMLQTIKQGTANAESTTLSFWHKHTKTGTNIVELLDADNANAVSGSYTQSVSNTWEKATITFPANTSGTYGNDNARSLRIRFIMGAGSNTTSGTLATTWQTSITDANRYVGQVNNADSTSNNFIITGVQYEVGTLASDFEFLPGDVNLQRCQRYYYLHASGNAKPIGIGFYYSSAYLGIQVNFPTTMRSGPSTDNVTGSNYYKLDRNGGNDVVNTLAAEVTNENNAQIYASSSDASGTAGQAGRMSTNNGDSRVAFVSEL